MGDSSGSAEKSVSSKSKKSSSRPRSSEGGSEQNSEDKTRSLAGWRSLPREILQLKCNTYPLLSTGSSKSLAQQLHEHFCNKQDEEELESIPPPPKRRKRSTAGKSKTAQQVIQEIEHVNTPNQQLDVKELAANIQNLTECLQQNVRNERNCQRRSNVAHCPYPLPPPKVKPVPHPQVPMTPAILMGWPIRRIKPLEKHLLQERRSICKSLRFFKFDTKFLTAHI